MTYSSDDILKFGKYKGQKVKEIAKRDPNYLRWCLNNIDSFKLNEGVNRIVDENYKVPTPYWCDEDDPYGPYEPDELY